MPLALRRGLSYADAMIGHYELIACDAAALILRDGVVVDSPPGYLEDLCAFFRKIPEFQLASVEVEFLPPTDQARRVRVAFSQRRRAQLVVRPAASAEEEGRVDEVLSREDRRPHEDSRDKVKAG